MTQKIAVAIIHGIGTQKPDFAKEIIAALDARCRADCGDDIVAEAVHWAPVLDQDENLLWDRLQGGGRMRLKTPRRFLIDFLGDAFAYQIAPGDREVYDAIHRVFAQTLQRLAARAGATAPLCIIAHSLGTVITSNFVYDLQTEARRRIISEEVRAHMTGTPLERGDTLTLLYTMGSPIGLWSLRYPQFGKPIQMPAPHLHDYYPGLVGEWINFYDADDVVGFPLKTLNDEYAKVVTADREINAGKLWNSWNPLSHLGYWGDQDVIAPIAKSLIKLWKGVNPQAV